MRLTPSLLALTGSLLLIAGCTPSANVDVNTDGSMQVETDDGTVITGGMAVPDDWSSDVPVYANGDIQYTAAVNPIDGKPGQAMVLTTSDSAEMVADYYKTQLETNGWTLEAAITGPMGTIMGGTKGNRSISMLISQADGVTSVTIGVETHTD